LLIYDNSKKLGDGLLNKHEALQKAYEETDRHLQEKYRLPDHEDLKDEKTRTGQRMHSSDFIHKIKGLNSKLWVEETVTPRFGTVLNWYTTGKDEDNKEIKKCLTAAFYPGWLPEFSWMEVDRADLITKENRGWRTVLLRLMAGGVLTLAQVIATFGDASGPASTRWHKETQRYRNQQ
jgi:hypothetical protein